MAPISVASIRRRRLLWAITLGGAGFIAACACWWRLRRRPINRALQQQSSSRPALLSPASGVVSHAYDHLLDILQRAGEGREAINDALQTARRKITAKFALDERQRTVRDAERQPGKRLRSQARRELLIATLARTMTALYCLALTRAITLMKLLIMRRVSHRSSLLVDKAARGDGKKDTAEEGDSWLEAAVASISTAGALTIGGRAGGGYVVEERAAVDTGRRDVRQEQQDKKGESAGGLNGRGGEREVVFLTLLEGPFSITSWVDDVCSRVEAGMDHTFWCLPASCKRARERRKTERERERERESVCVCV